MPQNVNLLFNSAKVLAKECKNILVNENIRVLKPNHQIHSLVKASFQYNIDVLAWFLTQQIPNFCFAIEEKIKYPYFAKYIVCKWTATAVITVISIVLQTYHLTTGSQSDWC